MFGRIRRLEISLAAKCQILFGAAVVLIIAAALLVPWQRMEQLTEQLDERAAAALADDALARHIADHGGISTPTPPAPSTAAPLEDSSDTTVDESAPDDAKSRTRSRWRLLAGTDETAGGNPDEVVGEADDSAEGSSVGSAPSGKGNGNGPPKNGKRSRAPLVRPPAARLLGLGTDHPLTRFDRRAFGHFAKQRDSDAYFTYERRDSGDQFRYAKPLYLTRSCIACHALEDDGTLTQVAGIAAGAAGAVSP